MVSHFPNYVIPNALMDNWSTLFSNLGQTPSYYASPGKIIFNAFVSSKGNISVPDIQIRYHPKGEFEIVLQRVKTKGSITLESRDPFAEPNIILNSPLDPDDLEAFVWGVEFVRSLIKSPPFSSIIEKEISPAITNIDELKKWINQTYTGWLHFTGTCPLGTSPDSVVDTSLRVKSVSNVRVADASVLPHSGNGNIHNTVLATALRASDIILGKQTVKEVLGSQNE